MHAKIIQIGNSKGLRLNKAILKKYNIGDRVEILLKEDCLIIKPLQNPRIGWNERFAELTTAKEEELLIPDVFNDEELEEWK